jgi:hypothetical protein
MQKCVHNIYLEKRQFFRRKLSKIAENYDRPQRRSRQSTKISPKNNGAELFGHQSTNCKLDSSTGLTIVTPKKILLSQRKKGQTYP